MYKTFLGTPENTSTEPFCVRIDPGIQSRLEESLRQVWVMLMNGAEGFPTDEELSKLR